MENFNTPRYLEDMRTQVLQILSNVSPISAPILTGQDGTTQVPSLTNIMDVSEDRRVEQQRQEDMQPDSAGGDVPDEDVMQD